MSTNSVETGTKPALPANTGWRWILLALVTVGNYLAWYLLWRMVYLSGDDFRASLNGGAEQYGRSTLGQIWAAGVDDYLHWNGRFADAIVKLQISLGYEAWQLISPLLLTLLAAVATALIYRIGRVAFPNFHLRTGVLVVVYLLVSLIPFALIGTQPLLGSTMFFFNAAVVGYGLALLLLLVGLWLLFGRYPKNPSVPVLVLLVPLFFSLSLINESVGFAGLVLSMVALALPATRVLARGFALAAGASLVGFVVFFLAPGRASRQGLVHGAEDSLLVRSARGALMVLPSGRIYLVLVLIITLVALAIIGSRLVADRGAAGRWPLIGAGIGVLGTLVLFAASVAWTGNRDGDTFTAAVLRALYQLGSFKLMVLGLGLLIAGWFLVVYRLPAKVRDPLVLLTVAAVVSAGPAVAMGLYPGRPYIFIVYLLSLIGVLVLTLGWSQARSRGLGLAAGVLVLATIAFAGMGYAESHRQLTDVYRLWHPVEQELVAVGSGAELPAEIILPSADRYPDELWSRLVSRSEGSEAALREWFGIPDSVKLEWR